MQECLIELMLLLFIILPHCQQIQSEYEDRKKQKAFEKRFPFIPSQVYTPVLVYS
jgi:hypothetical protein